MKHLKYYTILITIVSLFNACQSDDSNSEKDFNTDPVENLNKVIETQNSEGYNLAFYSSEKDVQTGSNILIATITKNNKVVVATDLQLSITMYMNSHGHNMSHGAPVIQLTTTNNKGFYEGFIFPTMASNGANDYWILRLTATVDNQIVVFESNIDVKQSKNKTITSFNYQDLYYTVALISPKTPKIGLNSSSALLFTTEEYETFKIADSHTIHIDPRMPSMKNHGSPNNINLTQAASQGFYTGQLSLTMSGYWKINLMIEDSHGTIIKGNPITEEQESSDIYFELEF